jgi:hypothetical protein
MKILKLSPSLPNASRLFTFVSFTHTHMRLNISNVYLDDYHSIVVLTRLIFNIIALAHSPCIQTFMRSRSFHSIICLCTSREEKSGEEEGARLNMMTLRHTRIVAGIECWREEWKWNKCE